MPLELFNELRRKYVVHSKISVKKKQHQSEIKVDSRYMNWQKKPQRQLQIKSTKEDSKED